MNYKAGNPTQAIEPCVRWLIRYQTHCTLACNTLLIILPIVINIVRWTRAEITCCKASKQECELGLFEAVWTFVEHHLAKCTGWGFGLWPFFLPPSWHPALHRLIDLIHINEEAVFLFFLPCRPIVGLNVVFISNWKLVSPHGLILTLKIAVIKYLHTGRCNSYVTHWTN